MKKVVEVTDVVSGNFAATFITTLSRMKIGDQFIFEKVGDAKCRISFLKPDASNWFVVNYSDKKGNFHYPTEFPDNDDKILGAGFTEISAQLMANSLNSA
jgi:hypothetical protein